MTAFDQITLHTERLQLRPLREADAAALFAIFADPRVARYLSRPPWPDVSLAHERIARDIEAMSAGHYACLGIVRRADGRLLGECSLFNLQQSCRRAELGYSLASEAWGSGYMSEALRCLLAFGFSRLGLNRVEADIDPRNLASARLLERLGFAKEGHLRERWIVAGEVSDSALYGLLASDWQSTEGGAGRPCVVHDDMATRQTLSHTLRKSTASDAEFIYSVAEQTMRHHVEAFGKRWSVAKMQAKCAQDAIDAHTQIVQVQDRDCGVFSFEVGPSEVWLHAILLQPEFQGAGIGSHLLTHTLRQARARGLPVRLHVMRANPAKAFYEKFGFVVDGDNELHYAMQRTV